MIQSDKLTTRFSKQDVKQAAQNADTVLAVKQDLRVQYKEAKWLLNHYGFAKHGSGIPMQVDVGESK